MTARRIAAAFEQGAPQAAAAGAYPFPGIEFREPESSRRRVLTGSFAALIHFGVLGALILIASLAPMVDDELIPVQLLRDLPTPDEPAPAPKALAERRSRTYAPQIQAVQPQIVNPRVVAEAVPAIQAEALHMDAVSSVAAPTQINRSRTVVERVRAVNSVAGATAAEVDVAHAGGSVVRGPIRAEGPVGPSVGPRKVAAATTGTTTGTGLDIGGGSSVRDGVISTRDVLGSADGPVLVRVDTTIGEGLTPGSGGTGTSLTSGTTVGKCIDRPEVQSYLADLQTRMLDRWELPPGLRSDLEVTLRFKLDVAGSATRVNLVRASDNAFGASAVDALRAAAPFPPMPERVRCLTLNPIIATFRNPVAG